MNIERKALLKSFLICGFIILPILATIQAILKIWLKFDIPDFAIGIFSGYMFRVYEKRFQGLS